MHYKRDKTMQSRLRQQNLPTLPSTLKEEIQNQSVSSLRRNGSHENSGANSAAEIDVFTAIRQLRNHY